LATAETFTAHALPYTMPRNVITRRAAVRCNAASKLDVQRMLKRCWDSATCKTWPVGHRQSAKLPI